MAGNFDIYVDNLAEMVKRGRRLMEVLDGMEGVSTKPAPIRGNFDYAAAAKVLFEAYVEEFRLHTKWSDLSAPDRLSWRGIAEVFLKMMELDRA